MNIAEEEAIMEYEKKLEKEQEREQISLRESCFVNDAIEEFNRIGFWNMRCVKISEGKGE